MIHVQPRSGWRRRGRTLPNSKHVTQGREHRALARSLDGEATELRDPMPATRGDCQNADRPCPHVGCRFHLYVDVNDDTGSMKLNFPASEVDELRETCALDVADRGGVTLEEVGDLLGITRERVRQIEVRALLKLKARSPRR